MKTLASFALVLALAVPAQAKKGSLFGPGVSGPKSFKNFLGRRPERLAAYMKDVNSLRGETVTLTVISSLPLAIGIGVFAQKAYSTVHHVPSNVSWNDVNLFTGATGGMSGLGYGHIAVRYHQKLIALRSKHLALAKAENLVPDPMLERIWQERSMLAQP